jgi:WD40 repeat protein
VNRENALFEINLTNGETDLISETFDFYGRQGAYWNAGAGEIVYLDQDHPIRTEDGKAFSLFPFAGGGTRYFASGSCDAKDFCQSEGVYKLTGEGDPERLDGVKQPVFSPDGRLMAFLNPEAATPENRFHIYYLRLMETEGGLSTQRNLFFPDEPGYGIYPEVDSYAFSPDGNMLYILYNVYSEYYERSMRLQTYLWNLEGGNLYDFGKLEGVSASLEPRFAWSPEGDQILLFLTDLTEEGEYRISVYLTDLTTGEKLVLLDEAILTGSDYTYLTNLAWH